MDMNPAATRAMASMLEARTGQQLAASRNWRVELALTALMQERALDSIETVARLAASGKDPALSEAVVEALLNNETSFFRDAAAFALLMSAAVPALLAARPADARLRVWCAGCSTGQEAYSL
ncbi:MAG: CheR family methyltransferase, partial [Sphingomonas sp.]